MVADLPVADLRELRRQVSDALFNLDRPAFVRAAALSKAVPGAIAARLTEAILPPIISARVAEVLDPARAADLVTRLSESYVAEVAVRMDAARSPQVIEAIPAEKVGAVARELARREEWVVIGGFVSAVSPAALAAAVAAFSGEQLLRIGFVLDDPGRLDDIAGMLTGEQTAALVAAAAESALWAELAEIVTQVSPARRTPLVRAYAAAPQTVRATFAAAAASGELPAGVLAALAG
jgi:hypothetical protein